MSAPVPDPAAPASRPEPPPLTGWQRALVAAVLLGFLGLTSWGAWVKSETYDEPLYILAGYSYWQTADFSLNREHPPLAKLLIGLPLLALDLELPDDYQQRPGIAFTFFAHQPRVSARSMLFLARLGGIAMGLALGLYVLRWARLAFGNGAGVLALALCLLNPNILAHARVAANDMAPTLFLFAASYHLWRWLDSGRRTSLLLLALTTGCALASKLSALMLLPVAGLIVLAAAVARRRPMLVAEGLLALLAALAVPYALYLGEARSLEHAREHVRFDASGGAAFETRIIEDTLEALFGAETPIPLLSLAKGLDHQIHHVQTGHPTYFRGELTRTGSRAFYAVATVIKNPTGLLMLLGLGLLAWRRTWRGGVHEACLLGLVALQYVVYSRSEVQLGFKYMLPVVPCLAVMASRAWAVRDAPRRLRTAAAVLLVLMALAAELLLVEPGAPRFVDHLPTAVALLGALLLGAGLVRARRRWAATAALLGGWAVAEVIPIQPHDLMYFNRWAGGPERGTWYMVVGDDWGQDVGALGRWMAEHDVPWLYYDYYGTSNPAIWGVTSRPIRATRTSVPRPGLYAVHMVDLRRRAPSFTWLEGLEPVARLGHSILVYEVTRERVDAWQAGQAGAAELLGPAAAGDGQG